MVSTMDERLAAMQRQLDTTTAQNQVLATRLRQVAEAYRGMGALGGGMPLGGWAVCRCSAAVVVVWAG